VKNPIILAIIGTLAWFGYGKYKVMAARAHAGNHAAAAAPDSASGDEQFTCDGRTYCSQMCSCAEATHFIRYCPGTKMDGDHDGAPCERQWCS